jgi:hypothetical protein
VLLLCLSEFYPEDIFNAYERGLLFSLLPHKTCVFKGESCHGGKRSKDRITAFVSVNLDRSENIPLAVN